MERNLFHCTFFSRWCPLISSPVSNKGVDETLLRGAILLGVRYCCADVGDVGDILGGCWVEAITSPLLANPPAEVGTAAPAAEEATVAVDTDTGEKAEMTSSSSSSSSSSTWCLRLRSPSSRCWRRIASWMVLLLVAGSYTWWCGEEEEEEGGGGR